MLYRKVYACPGSRMPSIEAQLLKGSSGVHCGLLQGAKGMYLYNNRALVVFSDSAVTCKLETPLESFINSKSYQECKTS